MGWKCNPSKGMCEMNGNKGARGVFSTAYQCKAAGCDRTGGFNY
jgi:hypothetical protein